MKPLVAAFTAAAVIGSALVGCSEDPPVAAKAVEVDSPLVALTPGEYNNTVRDLLGLPSDGSSWPSLPADVEALVPSRSTGEGTFGAKAPDVPPWPWPLSPEAGIDGFEGMAKGQATSPYRIEQLQKAALTYAAYTLVSPIFFTCDAKAWRTLAKDKQKDCASKSVLRFAQRAYRRPISGDEGTRLTAFFDANWADSSANEAIVLTIAGVLQAPALLYRAETGETGDEIDSVRPLTGWEMASRLSYFLWDSMPDPVLFQAAATDALRTQDQVQAQAERMLKDKRARASVVRFHNQWLGTDAVLGMSPARRQYATMYGLQPTPPLDTTGDAAWPSVLNPVRHSLKNEADLFYAHVVFDGPGTLAGMLTDRTGWVSEKTGPIYGVGNCTGIQYPGAGPGKGSCTLDPKKVDTSAANSYPVAFGGVAAVYQKLTLNLYKTTYPAGERAGILTLGSVLAIGAHPVHPSPILRGVRILDRLMCRELGTPPPTAEAGAPSDSSTAPKTNRARTEESTKTAGCAGCHSQINPPGFAFENYDSFGRFRAKDNGETVNAADEMEIPGEGKIAFKNAVELAKKLSTSSTVHDCYATRWVRYATGVEVGKDHSELTRLQADFRADSDIKKLLVAITASDLFRFRRAGGK